ncbi:MAG: ATP-grasp domain-containing protein [Kiritimatiellae bacterium]|nr:ATP-grasp domain-containing protein [Kiritimatiellia bacterium]
MKDTLTVLVTSVGSTTALSVIKGLRKDRRRAYRVIGTDASELNVAGTSQCDAFYHLPHGDTGWYISALKGILEAERVDAFIPIIDSEVELIAKQRGPLGDFAARCLIPEYGTVKTCNDKYRLYRQLKKQADGLGVPDAWTLADLPASAGLAYPLFIKPRRGISSKDCYRIDGADELEVFARRIEDPVICDFLPGDQYVIDTLSDPHGRCLLSVPRREFEAKAGVGVKAQICLEEDLIDYGRRLVTELGIVGPACIEVMKNGAAISLIEVNPRVSACLVLTIEAGVNIPALIVDLVLGQAVRADRLRVRKPGVYMSRYWAEVYFGQAELGATRGGRDAPVGPDQNTLP